MSQQDVQQDLQQEVQPELQQMVQQRRRRRFLLGLAVAISVLLYFVVQGYVVSLVLAAVIATLMTPLYRFFLSKTNNKTSLSSFLTVLLTLIVIIAPVTAFFGVLIEQAIGISNSAATWAQSHLNDTAGINDFLDKLPFGNYIQQNREALIQRLGQVVGRVGSLIANGLGSGIKGGVLFFIQAFIFLYAFYYFLISGIKIVKDVVSALPLSDKDSYELVKTFTSVSRATLKGSLVIGIVQGTLAGIAYYFAGIDGPVFWGAVTALFSIVPGIGAPIVWIPLAIYLFATGHQTAAIGMGFWCALVVGTVDNLLRPVLVGRDTQMPDILVLITTLGGIAYFGGLAGVIIGPLIGALFLTAWKLWGEAAKDNVPETTE